MMHKIRPVYENLLDQQWILGHQPLKLVQFLLYSSQRHYNQGDLLFSRITEFCVF